MMNGTDLTILGMALFTIGLLAGAVLLIQTGRWIERLKREDFDRMSERTVQELHDLDLGLDEDK